MQGIEKEIKLQKRIDPFIKSHGLFFHFDIVKIENLFEEIIQDTEQELIIVSPESHQEKLIPIFNKIQESIKFKRLIFSFLLTSNHQFVQSANLKRPEDWKIHVWTLNTDIPFGIIINDTNSVLLLFQDLCLYLYDQREVIRFKTFVKTFLDIMPSLTK